MIIFQTANWQYDLTDKGISFNEDSEFFSDKITKNFSFPFNIYFYEEIAEKLGLINIDNVRNYKSKIDGFLIIDNNFYDAYLSINEVKGESAEITLFYGKETLPVFDKKLSELPWPVIDAVGGLPVFAKNQIIKTWPEATHNFVKIYRSEIAKEDNYSHFENYVNNYVFDGSFWNFPVNTIDLIDGQNVSVNRNVMAPFTYLLEIFKVAFGWEGLEVRGDFVNDDFNKKIVIIPKNYFEKLAVSQFENYSFNFKTSQQSLETQYISRNIDVFTKIHTPQTEGTFTLKFKINMSDAMASYFRLIITHSGSTIYRAASEGNQVDIDETIDINVTTDTIFDDIIITLQLYEQFNSIADYNNFTYEYKEGSLNIFPDVYTLADFMPDMNFREFINRIKSWLNLSFTYTHNAVYINYLENINDNLIFSDKTHLQQETPSRILNKNNLFKLSYPNKQMVMINKTGQTYTDTGYSDGEIEKMEIQILPLKISSINDIITAVYPKDEEDIMICLYNGVFTDEPLAVDNIANRKLDLQYIYDLHWKKWLKFRANSETYKDSFFMHVTEELNIKEGIFKNNKNHLITTIRKKRVNEEYWKVDMETETF